ncbi:putative ankyrin repeat protein [Aspergillus lentulus]|uniref:Ankyrin repeat protein n=1 Tax=Aspergillus lentulus TaxID=293939 RepID=A0ABQ1B532_ASPLE|nr:putative ankyrin repeat protein [Aspergillus lentulus]
MMNLRRKYSELSSWLPGPVSVLSTGFILKGERGALTCWLQGSSGTGKTYLTSRVIDLVQGMLNNTPKDEGFTFFYCDKTEPNYGQALSIFQSYMHQLSTTARNPGSIQTRLKEKCKKAQDAGSTLRFDACKQQILESLNLYTKTTLVLDAFDECDPESRGELADALKSLLLLSKNTVKVFISSRPDPDIQCELEGCTSVSIQASSNQLDIQNFLEEELEKLAKTTACIRRLKTAIVDKLLARCQGMFQWAALQIHQIRTCKTDSSVLKRLDTLPEGLQKAYDEVWSEIERLEEPDQRLLLLDDEIDEPGLLSLCKNLLVIDSQLNVWRFVHLSVCEYLENKVKWTIERAHFHAARVSLLVLDDTFKKIGPDAASDPSDWPTELDSFNLSHPFQICTKLSHSTVL